MKQRRLWFALAACVVGAGILVTWFGRYSPVSSWKVVPSSELVAKGRQVALHFGVNIADWKASESPSVSKSLTQYRSEHAVDASPLSLRIKYVSKDGGQTAEVGFDSDGRFIYWRPPAENRSAQKFSSDADAADAAFQFVAGSDARSYKPPVRHMGDDMADEDYTWKRIPVAGSDIRENIEVTIRKAVVWKINRTTSVSSYDDDAEGGLGRGYWDVFASLFGLISTAGTIVILSIYLLWLVRKAINHQFPIRLAVLSFAVMIVVGRAGFNTDKIIGSLFMAGLIFCFVAVGRGISPGALPKWMSLEQICLLAPLAKDTGESVAAGILFSPLMVSIPFLVVGPQLLPHAWIVPRNAELLYSHSPAFAGFDVQSSLYLLGFFGFLAPFLEKLSRYRVLRWLVLCPIGILFFTDAFPVVSGPIVAPLVAGFLIFGLLWFVWAQFDVLALLVLQFSSGLLLTIMYLVQKSELHWEPLVTFAALFAAAYICYIRGREVAMGDPRATAPEITGFRDERAKLRAEFSVARRAQQDMLPATPPSIPGFTLAASCTPSLEVGGDLYDFLHLEDGRTGIGVADVSGKGVPAALYMTLTKGLLAAVSKDSSDLASIVEEVNRHLHGVTRKKVFVTMVLGFLDPEKRILQCARAGHNPIVWRRASQGTTSLVSPPGLGLGITASRVFSTQLKVEGLQLSAGDAVVFYSDGITEAMNRDLEQFGEQRLMEAVEKTDELDAASTRDSILGEVRTFLDGVHPQDDMTLVVLRVGDSN